MLPLLDISKKFCATNVFLIDLMEYIPLCLRNKQIIYSLSNITTFLYLDTATNFGC